MLPACRTEGETFAMPQLDLSPSDVEGFVAELQAFHEVFADCFTRPEPREHFFRYMVGQFSDLECKSIEPMALEVEGGNVRAMQRLISDAMWDEDQMRWTYHHLVQDQLGDPRGVVIVDESGFPKKGQDSVGVARQYCGSLGKVENCQVGVFAAYASPRGYALLDKRLFLPEAWLMDDYAARRAKCKVPPDLTFRTKPQLAAQMLETLHDEAIVPFKYVVADCLYGNSPEFLAVLDRFVDCVSMVAIPSDTRAWLAGPMMETKQYRYGGAMRTKRQVAAKDRTPPSVAAIAQSIPENCWYRRTGSEGTKGPIEYEFTKRRVTLCRDGLPERTVWLIMKRSLGAPPVYWYYISNAPLSSRLPLFVWLSGMRWAIEQCFEEAKTALGMDHYEVRKYPGWHHHMLTSILAHFFLWHLKVRLEKKSTRPDRVATADVTRSRTPPADVDDRRRP
jgi:SRSO17 transposase